MKHFKPLSFFIVPTLGFFLVGLLQYWFYPVWMAYYDPDYSYLLNGLNIVMGWPPEHIDHPGTPVHIFAGLVIFIISKFRSLPLPESILGNAEQYLSIMTTVTESAIYLLLALSGWLIHKAFGKWIYTLVTQFAPFGYFSVLHSLHRFNPEPFLFTSTVIVATAVVLSTAWPNLRASHRYSAAIGGFSAFAVATKVTYAPFLLLLLSPKKRMTALTAFALSLYAFVFPIRKELSRVQEWLSRVFFHSGGYGNGENKVMTLHQLFVNLVEVARSDWDILIFLLVAGLILFKTRDLENRGRGIWFAGFLFYLCQVFQMLMDIKMPNPRYILSSMVVVGFLAVLLFELLSKLQKNKMLATLLVGSLFLPFTRLPLQLSLARTDGLSYREQVKQISKILQTQNPHCARAYLGVARAPAFALRFGDVHAGSRYSAILNRLYPRDFFIYPGGSGLHTFDESRAEVLSCYHVMGSRGHVTDLDSVTGYSRQVLYDGSSDVLIHIQKDSL